MFTNQPSNSGAKFIGAISPVIGGLQLRTNLVDDQRKLIRPSSASAVEWPEHFDNVR